MAAARNYHSTAVLMPDGTRAGGRRRPRQTPGRPGPVLSRRSTPRPTCSTARDRRSRRARRRPPTGRTSRSRRPTRRRSARSTWSSLGADTHQTDMDQHFVPLSFTAERRLADDPGAGIAALAPPGNYMLFIVNGNGRPVGRVDHRDHAARADRARPRPPNVAGDRRQRPARSVSLDRARRRREPDHLLHGHPVHRVGAPQTPTTVTGNPPRRPRPRSPASPTAPPTRSP